MKNPVVLVHPDDINLADAKACAAYYDTTVVGSPYVPRGQMLLADIYDPAPTTRTPEESPDE